ncbi:MAG: hypothetical protein JWN70_693 [Planctomycetaceae bacterium]|nr:hypothetical protein [Planctomycetaceae bacterium]
MEAHMTAAHQRRTMFFVLGAIAAAIALAGGVVVLRSYLDPFDDQPFLQSVWAAANAETRASMARDAIKQVSVGASADQVRDLLGKPEPVTRYSGAIDAFGNRLCYPETWSYYLGSWNWGGLDSAFVYVHFNSDRKVASVEITGG